MNNSLEVFSVFSNDFDAFIKTMQEIHGMQASYIVNHSIFIGGMQFSRGMPTVDDIHYKMSICLIYRDHIDNNKNLTESKQ